MMIDLRHADNHAGFNVERWTPEGWAPVTELPFVTRGAADSHLDTLDRSTGEFRVYEALHARRVAQTC